VTYHDPEPHIAKLPYLGKHDLFKLNVTVELLPKELNAGNLRSELIMLFSKNARNLSCNKVIGITKLCSSLSQGFIGFLVSTTCN